MNTRNYKFENFISWQNLSQDQLVFSRILNTKANTKYMNWNVRVLVTNLSQNRVTLLYGTRTNTQIVRVFVTNLSRNTKSLFQFTRHKISCIEIFVTNLSRDILSLPHCTLICQYNHASLCDKFVLKNNFSLIIHRHNILYMHRDFSDKFVTR